MQLIELLREIAEHTMDTQDWNDLTAILDLRELILRQTMEAENAQNRPATASMMAEYRKVCRLQINLQEYLREALPV